MKLLRRSLALTILCLCLSATAGTLGQQVLTLDDIFKSERIGGYGGAVVAPDGDAFVFTRKGPAVSLSGQPHVGCAPHEVWVAPFGNGAATRIKSGDSDNLSYWFSSGSPERIWSPDSKRLAIYSGEPGEVSLCVWDRPTRRLTRLIERPSVPVFAWLDNTHLLASMQPKSAPRAGPVANVAMREWLRQMEGRTATVSVLESGVADGEKKRSQTGQVELVLIDVNSGAVRTLDKAPLFADILVCPSGQYFAYLKAVGANPVKLALEEAVAAWASPYFYQLVVSDASGRIMFGAKEPAPFVLPESFQWSTDGSEFAFLGRSRDDSCFRLFRGTVQGKIQEVALPDDAKPQRLIWLGDGRLVMAADHEYRTTGSSATRLDWWSVSSAGSPRNLTEKLAVTPSSLLPVLDGKALVGIAGGDLWCFYVESGEWANLTAKFDPKVDEIVWPRNLRRLPSQVIVVVAAQNGAAEYYRVDVQSGSMSRVTQPSRSAELLAYSPHKDASVFLATNSTGTSLKMVQGEKVRLVAQANEFMRESVPGSCRSIAYRSLDGKDLKGWILYLGRSRGKRRGFVTEALEAPKWLQLRYL
jgi:hypothetical protein